MSRAEQEIATHRARLQQLDTWVHQGVMKAKEADVERAQIQRRILALALPDTPAPRLPWRTHLRALLMMGVVVAVVVSWLLWGNAGLQPRTVAMLAVAQGRGEARTAHDITASSITASNITARNMTAQAPAAARPGAASSAAVDTVPGSLLDVRLELAPALQGRTDPDAAVFVELQAPGAEGLPLAAIRTRAGDLPKTLHFDPAQAVGEPGRLAAAGDVVVLARLSRSGRGRAEAGDLVGRSSSVGLRQAGVVVVIDRRLP